MIHSSQKERQLAAPKHLPALLSPETPTQLWSQLPEEEQLQPVQLLTDKEIQQLAELRWTHMSDEVTITLIPRQKFILHAEVCTPALQKGHTRLTLTLLRSKI